MIPARARFLALAALVGGCAVAVGPVRLAAQDRPAGGVPDSGPTHDHDHHHDGYTEHRVEIGTVPDGDPSAESELYGGVVAPRVDDLVGRRSGGRSSLRNPIRSLVRTLRERSTELIADDPAKRGRVLRNVTARALTAITDGADDADRALVEAVLQDALDEDVRTRRGYLWQALICWCPNENWTKTLSGCPDACANEQKNLVEDWLIAGYSVEEIVNRMVAHPNGGERVRGYVRPEGIDLLSYFLPLAFFATAVAVAVAFVLRKTRSARQAEEGQLASNGARAGGAQPREDDERWGEEIEKELKDMDESW